MALINKRCVPCEGGTLPLAHTVVEQYLHEVKEWKPREDGKSISRTFKFKNFAFALAFVNRVGALAEVENHHPDIELFGWNKVKLALSTHAIGGLSENDFILAAKINELVAGT